MLRRTGRHYAISHFRRLVIDLMHFSAGVPSVTIERRMSLAALVAARAAREPSPSWSALFAKALALVAVRMPELRTSYLKFPWPHFYEHGCTEATLNVAREVAGERVILMAHVHAPEELPLEQIDAIICHHREGPVDDIRSYRQAMRLSRVPWPLRRLAWWAALNVLGRVRCHHFGTFGITTVAAEGSSFTHLVPLLTATLHYGLFDAFGGLDMRLSFDHRVFDGLLAAQVLNELEVTLLGDILREVQVGPSHAEG